MKRALRFDPTGCDYGPASASVRTVLNEWAGVDWFVPPRGGRASVHGVRLFERHLTAAHAYKSGAVDRNAEVQTVAGGWQRFSALCERVRNPQSWDWKYSGLKPLSLAHSEARGWRRSEAASGRTFPADNPLFLRHNDAIIWMPVFRDGDDEGAPPPPEHASDALWYRSYADMDCYECLEWQLAEPAAPLVANPFYALLRCYAEGWYPFALGPASFVLFAFVGRPRL